MFQHIILITSSYVLGKRIGWHYADEDLDSNFVKEIREKTKDSAGALHRLTTSSSSWESVIKKDSFFEDVRVYSDLDEYLSAIEDSKKISAIDIAKLILSIKSMTHLKLQKLLYFVYADYLLKTGKPLFGEKILAYKFGPVVKEVFDEYRIHGREEISEGWEETENIEFGDITYPMVLSRFIQADNGFEIIKSVTSTLEKYGEKTAFQLVDLTHKDGSPWKHSIQSQEITDDLIKEYHCVEIE